MHDNYSQYRDRVQQELNHKKQDGERLGVEMVNSDAKTLRKLNLLIEKYGRTLQETGKTTHERQELATDYDKMCYELDSGFYCSKCLRSRTEIEKYDRENFDVHIRRVRSTTVRAPESAYRRLYDELQRKGKEKSNKIKQLQQESVRIEIEISKLKEERIKMKADFEARIAKTNDDLLTIARESGPTMYKLQISEFELRDNNCYWRVRVSANTWS